LKKQNVYIFGWPSFVGGADTKLAHLVSLLHAEFVLTVVPNDARFLVGEFWPAYLKERGVHSCTMEDLPKRLEGIGLAMSNDCFFTDGIAKRAKEKGLQIVWSSEMMWHHAGELDAVAEGVIDKMLYTSELQKSVLGKGYGSLPSHVTGNYIDATYFPFSERLNETFAIGRLSRPAAEKYPEDFPVFYERLDLPETRFRVMAWDEKLAWKYRWHNFDSRWDLLPAEAESQVQFLQSLDLFVYPLGHRFIESWGRSTVEAMLSGAIPLVPCGHHLDHLVVDGVTGFICADFTDFKARCHELYWEPEKRQRMRRAGRRHAEHSLCNREEHISIWREVFAG
jgi:glycosyltransferase involved in cell wall biosynthesis